MMKTALLVLLCLGSTLALFGEDSKVVTLTAANFKDLVVNNDDFWLVEFYGMHPSRQLLGADIASLLLLSSKRQQKY